MLKLNLDMKAIDRCHELFREYYFKGYQGVFVV